MTARATWKAFERRTAAALGGRRIPVTGIDRDGADVVTPMFCCQVKLRRSLPAWLFAWLGGIVRTTPEGKVGILILRTPRMRDAEALVVMRFSDFCDLHGAVRASESGALEVGGAALDGQDPREDTNEVRS